MGTQEKFAEWGPGGPGRVLLGLCRPLCGPEAGSASQGTAGFHGSVPAPCAHPQVPAGLAVTGHGFHMAGSHVHGEDTHAYPCTCTRAHVHMCTTHLDILFQSRVFWCKERGESEAALTAGAAVLWVRQGVVSTQHRPSATSVEGGTQRVSDSETLQPAWGVGPGDRPAQLHQLWRSSCVQGAPWTTDLPKVHKTAFNTAPRARHARREKGRQGKP